MDLRLKVQSPSRIIWDAYDLCTTFDQLDSFTSPSSNFPLFFFPLTHPTLTYSLCTLFTSVFFPIILPSYRRHLLSSILFSYLLKDLHQSRTSNLSTTINVSAARTLPIVAGHIDSPGTSPPAPFSGVSNAAVGGGIARSGPSRWFPC